MYTVMWWGCITLMTMQHNDKWMCNVQRVGLKDLPCVRWSWVRGNHLNLSTGLKQRAERQSRPVSCWTFDSSLWRFFKAPEPFNRCIGVIPANYSKVVGRSGRFHTAKIHKPGRRNCVFEINQTIWAWQQVSTPTSDCTNHQDVFLNITLFSQETNLRHLSSALPASL